MYRTPHVLLFAALYVLPSVACGQVGTAGAGQRGPAPGEPGGSTASAISEENSEDAPNPIPGTELGEATDKVPTAEEDNATVEADVQSQLDALKREFASRLDALERRLDQQIIRIDGLQKLNAALADAQEGIGESTTPPSEATSNAETDAEAAGMELVDRADITKLRAELDALSTGLKDAQQELSLVKQGQRDLDTRLGEIAASGGSSVLGNMQADPELRRELLRNTRYRLRIHNTTGVEQPLTVNGVQWMVRADEWTYVPVPLGPVTVNRSGYQPLEIAEENIDWQADDRGNFVEYDLDQHTVKKPETEAEAE